MSAMIDRIRRRRNPPTHVCRPVEVRVIDPDWFGTDEKVGWLRCGECGWSMCEPKIVGDGPILKELWE